MAPAIIAFHHLLRPLFGASLALAVAACAKNAHQGESLPEPPPAALTASGGAASLPPTFAAGDPPATSNLPPSVSAGGAAAGGAASAGGSAVAEASEPPLLDASGKALPQTDDKPRSDTPAFLRRMELLSQAIALDDPELAVPVFFPVIAYAEVKAIAKPERDHERRLLAAFRRNVHEYHRALGTHAADARFAGVDVPEAAARWMKPGSEGNRLGYYRVLRSRLRLALADGGQRTFEITSMISWRGQWYVVHLQGFE